MSIHDGHRQRLRERFLKEGLDSFDEHQVLELLLFYSLPRKDTNNIAHELIKRFGSLSAVLEAPVSELKLVPDIGDSSAFLMSFIAAFSRYYMINRSQSVGECLTTVESWCNCLMPYFLGKTNEVVYLLCLDAKGKRLGCKEVSEGSVNTAGVQVRKLVETALNIKASFVVLAHNHPNGVAIPSAEDISTTKQIATALRAVDVTLLDHIVFADNDSVSLSQSGFYNAKVSYSTI